TRLEGGQTPARLLFLGLRDAALAFVLSPLMLSLLLIRFEHAAEEPGPVVLILVVVHDHASVVLIVLVLGHDLECLGIGIGIVLPTHDRGRRVHVVFVGGVLRVLGVCLLRLPFVPFFSGMVELLLGAGKARGLPHLHPFGIASRRVPDDPGTRGLAAGVVGHTTGRYADRTRAACTWSWLALSVSPGPRPMEFERGVGSRVASSKLRGDCSNRFSFSATGARLT